MVATALSTLLWCIGTVAATGRDQETPLREKPYASIPPVLEAAFSARRDAIQTARIEWMSRLDRPGVDPDISFYSWQCAGDTYLSKRHGDAFGQVFAGSAPERADRPPPESENSLICQGLEWRYVPDETIAFAQSASGGAAKNGLADLRELSLNPVGWDWSIESLLAEYAPDAELTFQTHEVGALVRVETQFVDRQQKINRWAWTIDPARDFSVVQTEVYSNGQKQYETIADLIQIDGVWFPRSIERIRAGELEPAEVCEIISAELNRPEHPQTLGPGDIGVEPGMPVAFRSGQTATGGVWDGQRIVSSPEFFGAVAGGHAQVGPNLARALRRQQVRNELEELKAARERLGVIAPPQRFESEWERYTREFTVNYQLDMAQVNQAHAILEDCQQRANRHLDAHRPDFNRMERLVREALKSGSTTSAPADPKVAEQYRALRAPIDGIFEKDLKPRLDSLLTRQQRKLVPSAASRPATDSD